MSRPVIVPVDRDEAYEAHKLAFPHDYWPADVDNFWLARRNGNVVGFLAVFVDDRGLFISRVAVAVSEQGTGLGKRLVRHAFRFGRKCGYAHAYTYTLMKNYESMCMLLACGFRFIKPPKAGQYRGANVHYFARPLYPV